MSQQEGVGNGAVGTVCGRAEVMKNLETGARLTDLEEHALILFAPIKGCAVEEPVVSLHQGTGGVVAVQERAGGLGESKELGERFQQVSV